MDKIKLDPLASLVIQWGRNIYDSPVVENYFSFLDLTNVHELEKKVSQICPWHNEALHDTKYYMLDCLEKQLSGNNHEHLIIIMGAGKSPLSLKILSDYYNKINHVLEIDSKDMELKKELYDTHFPHLTDKIKCITLDPKSSTMLQVLNDIVKEYYKELPIILLVEGTSYYFTKEDISSMINNFRSENHQNKLLMEYILPPDQVCKAEYELPTDIIQTLKEFAGLDSLTTLTKDELKLLFHQAGGSLLEVVSSNQMEKRRRGTNKNFVNPNQNLLECSLWKF